MPPAVEQPTKTSARQPPGSSFAARHTPSAVVLASQVAAAVVHGVVKALEGSRAVDPPLVLLVRMLVTGLACSLYLWRARVPDFPLGRRGVRGLMGARAVAGICGAGGMYYSIMYLTLSQATAMNFLAPMGAMIIAKWTDHGTFGPVDGVGAAVALVGVFLVVQPDNVFHPVRKIAVGGRTMDAHAKLKGLGAGLVGVLGSITALTTMRRIGRRAHPLNVVNWFSWAVVMVATALVMVEQVKWPRSLTTWALLVLVGVFGGVMEFLLTVGISSDTSSAATMMIYSQVIWALILDSIFWSVETNVWTLVGVGSVVGSLIMVSLAKEVTRPGDRRKSNEGGYEFVALASQDDDTDSTVHDGDLDDLYEDEHVTASGDRREKV